MCSAYTNGSSAVRESRANRLNWPDVFAQRTKQDISHADGARFGQRENATKQFDLGRFGGNCGPVTKRLAGSERNNTRILCPGLRPEITGELQADDFGTPISIEAGRAGRPTGAHAVPE